MVAVNGVASGAGVMLALLGDRVVAAETAAFVLPEIDLDMPSFVGLAVVGWTAGDALAAELVLTGRRLDAAEARARWIIAACVTPDALAAAALAEAAALAAKPLRAFSLVKAALARDRRARLAAAVAETERVRAELYKS
ncbi:MAG: enoyl-CoA hydratase/isomerase family protein [Pseudomonadota bacterium]